MCKHWFKTLVAVVAAGMFCACHSHKKQAEYAGDVVFERAVERKVLFRDSMVESLRLALDSPEIVVFSPRDSTTVTVRARKAVVIRNNQQGTIGVAQQADTLAVHAKERSMQSATTQQSGFGWVVPAFLILVIIILLKKS